MIRGLMCCFQISVLVLISQSAQAPGAAARESERFNCAPPAGWEAKRDREKEVETRIQDLELVGPRADNAPVIINASFYGDGNIVFAGYEDFIDRNSKNILGETESDNEKFSPVRETTLAGRKAFGFSSEIKEYLNPHSTSAESVIIKEEFYVMPAGKGFFVLHYYAPASVFNKYLPVFKELASTCKVQ
jgi:hypothetical protein